MVLDFRHDPRWPYPTARLTRKALVPTGPRRDRLRLAVPTIATLFGRLAARGETLRAHAARSSATTGRSRPADRCRRERQRGRWTGRAGTMLPEHGTGGPGFCAIVKRVGASGNL